MKWFRMYNGAADDSKWLAVARKSGQPVPLVLSVVWKLMDEASEANERGSVAGYDPEDHAAYLGASEEDIEAILKALQDKKWIEQDSIPTWENRQPKREDSSAERTRKYREKKRNVTQRDAAEQKVTTRGDKKRVDNRKKLNKENFEKFWKEYPCKSGGKQDALKAYTVAKATHEEIMAGLIAYIANKESWREWKQAGPWLRAGMWTAEYEAPKTSTTTKANFDDPNWWRARTRGKVARNLLKNDWPVPGKNFPDGCPIAHEIWPEERVA